MDPLINPIMNQVECWSQNVSEKGIQSWAKRHILTRAVTVMIAVPLEIATVAQNIIAAPLYMVGAVAKLAVKSIRMCSSAELLRKLDESLPGPKDFIKTVLRVIAFTVGTFSTLFLGFISPSLNFRLHCSIPFLNLATNLREIRIKEEQKRKLEEEQLAQAEEILAAVAALFEKAELEAEKEAQAQKEGTEEKPVVDTKVVTQHVETVVNNGVTVVEKVTGEVDVLAPKPEQPRFIERFFGLKRLHPERTASN